jgi:hypothetical protein
MATIYKEKHARVIGADWVFDHTVTSTDANGVVTPVTGLSTATVISTIRHRDTSVQIWQGSRSGGQIVVTNDSAGQLRISVPRATTATLEQRLYDMDLYVLQSNAVVYPKRWFVQGLKTASIVA